MIAHVEGRGYRFSAGNFCLIQPGELHTLEGPAHTITPYVHLDVFHNPERERSFVVRSGRVDVSGLGDLMQPRLDEAAGVRVPTRFVPPHPAQFRDTMLKTIGIWQRRDFLGQLEAQYLATGLVLSMLRGYSRGRSESSEEPEFLNWITSFMSLHLSEPLSVSDMAARAGLSVLAGLPQPLREAPTPVPAAPAHTARPGPAPPHQPHHAGDLRPVRVLRRAPLRQDVQATLGPNARLLSSLARSGFASACQHAG